MKLRKIQLSDIEEYGHWKMPYHKYHDFNGPYFEKSTIEEVDIFIEKLKQSLVVGDSPKDRLLIVNKVDKIVGEVSWCWKSEETRWMEIGILIFDDSQWGKGIGYKALKEWISILFDRHHEIVRLGLTTWSGNIAMVKLAEKLQLKKEAEYRKARIVNDVYYDSVSYGVLREEWKALST